MLEWRGVDPSKLKPQFRAAIEDLFERCPYRFVVTHGLRTNDEQDRLYGLGRSAGELVAAGLPASYAQPTKAKVTNAKSGQSAHNFGCAIDVVLDANPATPQVEPDWTPSEGDGWMWLKAQVPKGHKLFKGGWEWGDWPHVEWRDWRTTRMLAQRDARSA